MNHLELLKVNADNLKKKQYEAIRLYVKSRLLEVVDAIDKRNYDHIGTMIEESPAGDGNGEDNYYIFFDLGQSRVGFERKIYPIKSDISDVIELLKELGGE